MEQSPISRRRVFWEPIARPEEHCLFKLLYVGFCVEYEAMWEEKWRYNIAIDKDHAKYNNVDEMFGLDQDEY